MKYLPVAILCSLLFSYLLPIFQTSKFVTPTSNALPQAVYNLLDEKDLRFERLGVKDGLSNSTVLAVLQDQKGFIWLGTADGLDRYDGNKITAFRHSESDPTTIGGNSIYALLETHDGTLWVGADPGGLNRYDQAANTFTTYLNDPDDPESLSDNGVWSLYEDKQGTLWVGTRNGLNAFDPQTGKFKTYKPDPNTPGTLAGSIVYCITEDHAGYLWVGTREGLNRLDRETGQFRLYKNDPENPASLSSNRVWGIHEDSQGILWIATRGGGLNRFDPQTGIFSAYLNDPNDPQSISDNNCWKIFEDQEGNLWVTTERGGLNRLDPLSGKFTSYQHNPNDPFSISHNDLFGLYKDRSGVLWITSRRGGVNKLYPAMQRFSLYKHIPENAASLNSNVINGILLDPQGILWIGTSGGGLNRLDRATNQVKVYLLDSNNPNSLPGNDIYTLYQDQEGLIWIGLQGGGLSRFDPLHETFTNYKQQADDPKSISSSYIPAIAPAADGKLWLGTLGFGVDLFDPASGEAIHFKNDPNNTNSLVEDTIYALLAGTDGKLWIGTGRGGADLFDPASGRFTHFQHDPQNPNSLINNTVQVIHRAQDGAIWFGTSQGLSRLDPDRVTFSNYTIETGLPNDNIYGILSDDQGNLWLSSGNGIIRFNPQSGISHSYDLSDGLQSIQFNLFSYFQGQSGEMFFGGPEGLNAFLPEHIIENQYLPSVALTDFLLFNISIEPGSLPLSSAINEMDELTLTYQQSVFSFEFAAFNYQASSKNLYQHKMEGFDADWSPPSTQTTATYTNLDPGSYTFMVRAANNDGLWNQQAKTIRITITPPWWETRWFLIGTALFSAGAIVVVIQFRIRNTNLQKKELEQRVIERTRELSETNQKLQDEFLRRERTENLLLETNAELQSRIEEISLLRDHLQEQATHDSLTGLYNRRFLEEDLQRELARAERGHFPSSVVLMDIDHFKSFNDLFGHKTGDIVLKKLGDLLRGSTRQGDIACRYGGEEFVVVLSGATLDDAVQRAEELRLDFQNLTILDDITQVPTTISTGIATFPQHGKDVDTLLDHADQALYKAKNSGRNCVKVYSAEENAE